MGMEKAQFIINAVIFYKNKESEQISALKSLEIRNPIFWIP